MWPSRIALLLYRLVALQRTLGEQAGRFTLMLVTHTHTHIVTVQPEVLLMLLTACRVIASAVRAAATAGQQPAVQEQNPLAALLAGPHSLPAIGQQ